MRLGEARLLSMAVAIGMTVLSTSCGPTEQGYWAKQEVAQALANEQYPEDSRQCEGIAAQSDGRQSEDVRSARYIKCMYARGYQWVVERPLSHPAKSAGKPPNHVESCSTGRIIVDAFGYPKCVPVGRKEGGPTTEAKATVTQESPPPKPDSLSPKPVHRTDERPTDERWIMEDHLCRQQAQDTLSSPYGIYQQCMAGKGWPSPRP